MHLWRRGAGGAQACNRVSDVVAEVGTRGVGLVVEARIRVFGQVAVADSRADISMAARTVAVGSDGGDGDSANARVDGRGHVDGGDDGGVDVDVDVDGRAGVVGVRVAVAVEAAADERLSCWADTSETCRRGIGLCDVVQVLGVERWIAEALQESGDELAVEVRTLKARIAVPAWVQSDAAANAAGTDDELKIGKMVVLSCPVSTQSSTFRPVAFHGRDDRGDVGAAVEG